jgi:hypothetical protein
MGGVVTGALFGFATFFLTAFLAATIGFEVALAAIGLRTVFVAFATFFALLTDFAGLAFFLTTLLFAPACFAFPTGRFLVLLFFLAMITFLLAV